MVKTNMKLEKKMSKKSIICLSAFCLLCILCIIPNAKSTPSCCNACPVHLKSYSIVKEGTTGNLSASFWNSFDKNPNVIISLFVSDPIAADPSSLALSFTAFETKSFIFEMTGIEFGISASIEVLILYTCNSKMYSLSYSIPITNIVVNDPSPTNSTVYVDVDVDVDVENNIYLFNNSLFKSGILVTGIACVGALYISYNVNDAKIQTLPIEDREKNKRKKHDLSKMYALAVGIGTYYVISENIRPTPFQFPYGYEVYALLIAGIGYFGVKLALSSKIMEVIGRLTIINGLISVILLFYQAYGYLIIPLALSIVCIIYLIYSHYPRKTMETTIIGKNSSPKVKNQKAKVIRDASFIEFNEGGGDQQ
jgi:hypothetical protein